MPTPRRSQDTIDDNRDAFYSSNAKVLLRELDVMSMELESKQQRAHLGLYRIGDDAGTSPADSSVRADREPSSGIDRSTSARSPSTNPENTDTNTGGDAHVQTESRQSHERQDSRPAQTTGSARYPGGNSGRIPEHLKPMSPNDSTDAAKEALRRHFCR